MGYKTGGTALHMTCTAVPQSHQKIGGIDALELFTYGHCWHSGSTSNRYVSDPRTYAGGALARADRTEWRAPCAGRGGNLWRRPWHFRQCGAWSPTPLPRIHLAGPQWNREHVNRVHGLDPGRLPVPPSNPSLRDKRHLLKFCVALVARKHGAGTSARPAAQA